MIDEMQQKGYRAYQIDSLIFKRHIDTIEKRFGLQIEIGGDNLIFVKTNDYKRHEMVKTNEITGRNNFTNLFNNPIHNNR